jgi:hypothetical protein
LHIRLRASVPRQCLPEKIRGRLATVGARILNTMSSCSVARRSRGGRKTRPAGCANAYVQNHIRSGDR